MTTPVDRNDPSTWPKPEFSGSSAITVFFVILMGAFSLGQIIPNITALIKVGSAASLAGFIPNFVACWREAPG